MVVVVLMVVAELVMTGGVDGDGGFEGGGGGDGGGIDGVYGGDDSGEGCGMVRGGNAVAQTHLPSFLGLCSSSLADVSCSFCWLGFSLMTTSNCEKAGKSTLDLCPRQGEDRLVNYQLSLPQCNPAWPSPTSSGFDPTHYSKLPMHFPNWNHCYDPKKCFPSSVAALLERPFPYLHMFNFCAFFKTCT